MSIINAGEECIRLCCEFDTVMQKGFAHFAANTNFKPENLILHEICRGESRCWVFLYVGKTWCRQFWINPYLENKKIAQKTTESLNGSYTNLRPLENETFSALMGVCWRVRVLPRVLGLEIFPLRWASYAWEKQSEFWGYHLGADVVIQMEETAGSHLCGQY